MGDFSVIDLFLQASLIVQLVMILLLMVSIISWIVIFERHFNLSRIKQANKEFEKEFWSGKDLNELYEGIDKISHDELVGSLRVFKHGFGEFLRLSEGQQITIEDLESVNRAIRVSLAREEESLMHHLPFLANVGSVSPYVGLFGTVWGIINSFQGLSDATQATINAVAPGISEALVATALGLFAAIPAVVAYNRFASDSDTQLQQSSVFGEELASILYRQTVKAKL
ncbi:protein TolQ [Pseudomonadota bacterium]|uniref:Tol-Pal system protein TolQ n=1 Tax=SAR86 cluster bacterium TaxID=2030880 RepID=A0A520LU41_9GAMM|nr:protein TolQ [Pseudomonadota bacterium]RZO12464.1 MAG: protein TolQ [SAR86 cluster bacterium]